MFVHVPCRVDAVPLGSPSTDLTEKKKNSTENGSSTEKVVVTLARMHSDASFYDLLTERYWKLRR